MRNLPPELTPEQQQVSTAAQVASSNFRSVDGSAIGSDLSIEGQAIIIRCKGSLRVNGHFRQSCVKLNCLSASRP